MKLKFKKTTSLLLSFFILVLLFPFVTDYAEAAVISGDFSFYDCDSSLKWSLDTDTGLLVISGSGDMQSGDSYPPYSQYSSIIKSVMIQPGVTSIGSYSFNGCYNLTDIQIPNTVKKIEQSAFSGCRSLIDIQLPDSILEIHDCAFDYCTSLTSITIPSGVTKLDWFVFSDCISLEEINLNDGLKTIGDFVFTRCSSLENISIPDSVESIGAGAFQGCSSLSSITIPQSVNEIAPGPFKDNPFSFCASLVEIRVDEANPYFSSQNGILFSKDCSVLIAYPNARNGLFSIPYGVTTIAESAFSGSSGLTEVFIPNTVTHIYDQAFSSCEALQSICIPDSTVFVGDNILDHTAYYNDVSKWEDGLLYCGHWLVASSSQACNVIIKDGTLGISEECFYNNTSIESVIIPYGISRIEECTFYGCSNLSSIDIPNSIVFISDQAFEETAFYYDENNWEGSILYLGNWVIETRGENAGELSIKRGTRGLSEYSFAFNNAIQDFSIPEGVMYINEDAFCWCNNLLNISIPSSIICIGDRAIGYGADNQYNTIVLDTVITGYDGTAAEEYALVNGLRFVSRGDPCLVQHMWSEWIVASPPSCVELGRRERECIRCGFVEQETLPTVPHNYVNGICSVCGVKAQSASEVFSDVRDSAYYADAVLWAVQNGITSGTGDGQFSPKKTCTREQVVTFLWKAAGSPEPGATSSPFPDVKPGKYYFKPVLWAVEHGITSGQSDGRFGVGKACTREQVVSFLWKAVGSPEPEGAENPFTDVKPGKYYYKPVLWAVENGVTSGASATSFGVGNSCTRAQIVTFLYNVYGK